MRISPLLVALVDDRTDFARFFLLAIRLWLFWLPVLISFALFFLVTQLPTLLVDAKRIGAKLLPFKGLITA